MAGPWLLIDDVRDLNCEAIARTPDVAKKLLAIRCWECVCFDHDLGQKAKSGYDVLKWAIENDHLPSKVQLVTSNPVGRQNMAALLLSAGFVNVNYDNVNFLRQSD